MVTAAAEAAAPNCDARQEIEKEAKVVVEKEKKRERERVKSISSLREEECRHRRR